MLWTTTSLCGIREQYLMKVSGKLTWGWLRRSLAKTAGWLMGTILAGLPATWIMFSASSLRVIEKKLLREFLSVNTLIKKLLRKSKKEVNKFTPNSKNSIVAKITKTRTFF